MTVEVFAPAKINLTLHVIGRRTDGYHLLDSLVVFARDVGDVIHVEAADRLELTVEGPFRKGVPTDETNLVVRAARHLQSLRAVQAGARLRLEKTLPHGAGIGGGSADAAAALKALALLWKVPPPTPAETLNLGADVPACMAGPAPMRMRGIGERLDPVPPLPPLWLVLVNPGRHVSTPRVFSLLGSIRGADALSMDEMRMGWDFEAFHAWLSGQGNDLTACATEEVAEIGHVLEALRSSPGCRKADMSGSGSTCWGLFKSAAAAHRAAETLAHDYPQWWVRMTAIN
ncbi:4-(cytidine 5'-diphospho)-2-C-methyl-D-erythritol kinase [Silicimonas algicola]|uniref:4-diphosphocytidyl-2-C-methyl-D-erythritol kinase n=1 Tax=Silicimonas algicola TaxID=1826607 RepID=A0A316G7M3_9RHOB|nr:4-(cytidine 5'-diphospho)-2-C-methyl-D-erythritol kinase [Silicimonas algicola]AZQ65688.1 4-(cytidine 5'-diphospho)-2-C-methyl-D-erythritol kinase [Silicimonas algicola]PWK56632.1 4-diphosphocytidyl-2-C-methyl-D-erythritol kinase [Silicimonas algicola]